MKALITIMFLSLSSMHAELKPRVVFDVCYEAGKLHIECKDISKAIVYVFTDGTDKEIQTELYKICYSVCSNTNEYKRQPNTTVFKKKETK